MSSTRRKIDTDPANFLKISLEKLGYQQAAQWKYSNTQKTSDETIVMMSLPREDIPSYSYSFELWWKANVSDTEFPTPVLSFSATPLPYSCSVTTRHLDLIFLKLDELDAKKIQANEEAIKNIKIVLSKLGLNEAENQYRYSPSTDDILIEPIDPNSAYNDLLLVFFNKNKRLFSNTSNVLLDSFEYDTSVKKPYAHKVYSLSLGENEIKALNQKLEEIEAVEQEKKIEETSLLSSDNKTSENTMTVEPSEQPTCVAAVSNTDLTSPHLITETKQPVQAPVPLLANMPFHRFLADSQNETNKEDMIAAFRKLGLQNAEQYSYGVNHEGKIVISVQNADDNNILNQLHEDVFNKLLRPIVEYDKDMEISSYSFSYGMDEITALDNRLERIIEETNERKREIQAKIKAQEPQDRILLMKFLKANTFQYMEASDIMETITKTVQSEIDRLKGNWFAWFRGTTTKANAIEGALKRAQKEFKQDKYKNKILTLDEVLNFREVIQPGKHESTGQYQDSLRDVLNNPRWWKGKSPLWGVTKTLENIETKFKSPKPK